MIKVMLVDDHKLVRDGLKALIEKNNDFKVVCEAKSGEEALDKITKDQKIDLLIIDISLPGISGIELTKQLKDSYPNLAVIILSMHDDEDYYEDALNAGAIHCLAKDSTSEELHSVMTSVFTKKKIRQ